MANEEEVGEQVVSSCSAEGASLSYRSETSARNDHNLALLDANRSRQQVERLMRFRAEAGSDPYIDGYTYLAEHGICLPDAWIEHQLALSPRFAKFRACYLNASLLATELKLTYWEGMAYRDGSGSYEHAWCVDPKGNVVDPSWGASGSDYFGIELPLTLVRFVRRKTQNTSKFASVLFSLWAERKLIEPKLKLLFAGKLPRICR